MTQSKEEGANKIIKAARYLKAARLTPGHTGNVSVRAELPDDHPRDPLKSAVAGGQSKARLKSAVAGGQSKAPLKDGFLITPTGMAYDSLTPEDIVYVRADGTWDEEGRAPSSEWQFHLAAYQANEGVNALVHTHSNFATTLASAGKDIPAFHYMVAAAGGDSIPLIPYAIFGSKKLSNSVGKAFQTRKACLMAHHGVLAGEKTLDKAVELTEIIEDLAQQYWAVCQLGEPKLLSAQQMQEVLEKFTTYGQLKS